MALNQGCKADNLLIGWSCSLHESFSPLCLSVVDKSCFLSFSNLVVLMELANLLKTWTWSYGC